MDKSRSILVVEDNEIVADATCENLRMAGYFPAWAATLTEATLIHNVPFSAVFLDLLLPETLDRNFARAVTSMRAHFPDAVLIILSAHLSETNVIQLLKCGADFALHKPLSGKNISEVLNRASELRAGKLDGILARLEAVELV